MGDRDQSPFRYGEEEFTDRVDSSGFGPRTRKLFEHLSSRVIGQDRAARRLAESLAIYYSGLKDPTKPIAGFVFAGPTGQGKTFMAEELARFLIADEPRAPLIRIPCAKYSERHRVSELIGSPPGYVDSDKVPGLSQLKIDEPHYLAKVRHLFEQGVPEHLKKKDINEVTADLYESNKPYLSVILFDEVEKAHQDLRNALLHIIDDGELPLPHGETTYFHNSVIILTCNIGGREQQQMLSGKGRLGFGSDKAGDPDADDQRIYESTKELISREFPPELVGRLDIIVYRALKREQAMLVLDNLLKLEQDKLIGKRSNSVPLLLLFAPAFKGFVLDEGFSRTQGMRALKKAVRKYVTLPLAKAIESGGLTKGDEVMFKMAGGEPALFRKPRARLLPAAKEPPKPPPGRSGGTGQQ